MTYSAAELAALGVTLPPTQADLPYDDGAPMESQRHQLQMELLLDGLRLWLEGREDGFVGGSMFVYYSLAQVRNRDFKEKYSEPPPLCQKPAKVQSAFDPDVFVALGVPKGERRMSELLGLSLVPVAGTYKGVEATWLRWATVGEGLLPTDAERAEQQAAIAIARNLLTMGMEPAQVAQATGLTVDQIATIRA